MTGDESRFVRQPHSQCANHSRCAKVGGCSRLLFSCPPQMVAAGCQNHLRNSLKIFLGPRATLAERYRSGAAKKFFPCARVAAEKRQGQDKRQSRPCFFLCSCAVARAFFAPGGAAHYRGKKIPSV